MRAKCLKGLKEIYNAHVINNDPQQCKFKELYKFYLTSRAAPLLNKWKTRQDFAEPVCDH
jgi:hypothetical protein